MSVAEKLPEIVCPGDTVARLGGDAFAAAASYVNPLAPASARPGRGQVSSKYRTPRRGPATVAMALAFLRSETGLPTTRAWAC